MGVDRERGKVLAIVASFVHIAPHQQRAEGDGRDALRGLEVSVGRHSQCRGSHLTCRIGHLLDAYDDHDVRHPARHSDEAHPQGSCPCRVCRLNLDRLYTSQPGEVSDEGSQVLLPRQLAGEHIAHIERIDARLASIRQGASYRLQGQMAQANLPMLAYCCLPHTGDDDVSHSFSFPVYRT